MRCFLPILRTHLTKTVTARIMALPRETEKFMDYQTGFLAGLNAAHTMALTEFQKADREHSSTKKTWFGGPSKKHFEWLGYSRACKTIATAIYVASKR